MLWYGRRNRGEALTVFPGEVTREAKGPGVSEDEGFSFGGDYDALELVPFQPNSDHS